MWRLLAAQQSLEARACLLPPTNLYKEWWSGQDCNKVATLEGSASEVSLSLWAAVGTASSHVLPVPCVQVKYTNSIIGHYFVKTKKSASLLARHLQGKK